MGAQSWFPSNHYPTDKATFDTRITVPSSKTAPGVGELVSGTPTVTARRPGAGPRTTRPRRAIQVSPDRAPDQINFLSDLFGRWPFASALAVADRAACVGYALEVPANPHYTDGFTTGKPSIHIGTQLHESAHQWVSNSVTLWLWSDIWCNESWTIWSEWWWQFLENCLLYTSPSPRDGLLSRMPSSA